MASLATGIDIIEISRIEKAVNTWQEAFLKRIFTPAELAICSKDPSRLAGRFAAKEATIKALDFPSPSFNWLEIEILNSASGKPLLKLNGKTLEQARQHGFKNMEISLSHCREYAVAVALVQC